MYFPGLESVFTGLVFCPGQTFCQIGISPFPVHSHIGRLTTWRVSNFLSDLAKLAAKVTMSERGLPASLSLWFQANSVCQKPLIKRGQGKQTKFDNSEFYRI